MDGTSAAASAPYRSRGEFRNAQSLPSCIPSRLDENGKPTAARVKSIAYRYEDWSARVASLDHPLHFPLDFGKSCIEGLAPRIEHDVPLRTQVGSMQTECLAKPALDAIPNDRSSDCTRDCKANPGTIRRSGIFARPAKGGEQGTGDAEAVIINKPEIGGAKYPGRPGKGAPAAGVSRPWRNGRLFRHSPSAYAGREPAAAPAPPGRPCFPSWRENRVSWRACDCWVETFFSACQQLFRAFSVGKAALTAQRRRRTSGVGSHRYRLQYSKSHDLELLPAKTETASQVKALGGR